MMPFSIPFFPLVLWDRGGKSVCIRVYGRFMQAGNVPLGICISLMATFEIVFILLVSDKGELV